MRQENPLRYPYSALYPAITKKENSEKTTFIPGSIIITKGPRPALFGNLAGKTPSHFALVVPKTNEHPEGVLHLTWKGITFHTLEFFFNNAPADIAFELIEPNDESLGVLAAKQAEVWYLRTDAVQDQRKLNIALQKSLLGEQPATNILDVLKMVLRRDTAYNRATDERVKSRGLHCIEWIINCYNAAYLGRFLDKRLKRRLTTSDYVSVKYANIPNDSPDCHGWDLQKETVEERSQIPAAYTQTIPGQEGVRINKRGFTLRIELSHPAYADAGPLEKDTYNKHARGNSPLNYLPPEHCSKTLLEQLTKSLPIPICAKNTTTPAFYDFLSRAGSFSQPLEINLALFPKHSEQEAIITREQDKRLKEFVKKNRSSFWRVHSESLCEPISRQCLLLCAYDNYQFSDAFFFKPSEDITKPPSLSNLEEAKDNIRGFQGDFVTAIKKLKSDEFPKKLSTIQKLTINPMLIAHLETGFPASGAAGWLKKAIELHHDDNPIVLKQLQQLHQHVSTYIIINQLLKALFEAQKTALKLIAPCNMGDERLQGLEFMRMTASM